MEPDIDTSAAPSRRPSLPTPSITFWLGLCFVPLFYWSTLAGGYLSDDFWWMSDLRTKGPFSVWTFQSAFFRPVASYEMWLFDRMAGGHPWLLRAVNLLLMILSAILVRWIAICLSKRSPLTRTAWIGTAAGLIFAYFSSHSEPVCWVSCICDTNCLFWGLAGVLAVLLMPNARTPIARSALAVSVLFGFALSMASKETGVIFPPLCVLLIPFIISGPPSNRVRGMAAAASVSLLFLAGYLWVHHVLQIGWGYKEQFSSPRPVIESNLGIDLPNMLLPFSKWLAAYNENWLDGPLNLLCLGFTIILLWRSGPTKEPKLNALKNIREYAYRHRNELILGWITAIYALDFLNAPAGFTLFLYFDIVLIVLALVALIRYGLYRNLWVRTALFAFGIWYLWSNEISILYDDFGLYGVWDVAPGKLAVLMLLLYVYLHRPSTGYFNEEEKTWARAMLVTLLCGALLLLPAVTVPFTFLDGRGQRFAYEASAFSAIAWPFALLVLFSRHRSFLRIATVGFLAMLAAALALNNRDWAYAGRISSTMARRLSELVKYKPRRIYMLSEVAFVGGAEALNNGDQLLIKIYCPGSTTEIQSACKQWGFMPGDHLTFEEYPRLVFKPALRGANATHFDTDNLIAARKGENPTAPTTFFHLEANLVVQVEGYEPGDVIAYLDGDNFKVVRWDHYLPKR